MSDYAILVYPSANRVYAEASPRLLHAELGVFGRAGLSTSIGDVQERTMGGVGYLTFRTDQPLSDADVALLSNVSTLYALFELEAGLLRPIELDSADRFDSDLLTIQKYVGKTNEIFTKLLLNVTVLATDSPRALVDGGLHVLDPLCGRGTTLNQAMMYGFSATGVERNDKDFDAYEQFIKTWLRTKRIKHTADSGALRQNKKRLGRRLEIEFGHTKELYKAGETRRLRYLNCDTMMTRELVRPNSVDVIVTDAPYGVQHGSQRGTELSRNPLELLASAVPGWAATLRPGGALGLSWNTHVVGREHVLEVLADAGLKPAEGTEFDGFAHRVDQAILRDVVVATK